MLTTLTAKRPVWTDEMLNELAQIIGKQVNEWSSNDTSLEDCIGVSKKILKYSSNDNGYELAGEFENEGWLPDSELVEILEHVYYEKINIQEAFVKKWVTENNLKLDLTLGQKVSVFTLDQGKIECEIVELYPETMKYGVWHKAMGYAKDEGHTVVPFECVTAWSENNDRTRTL